MREKIYAMLCILVDKSLKGPNILHDEREISSLLLSRGFPQEDIYDILSWLQQFPGDQRDDSAPQWPTTKGKAVRVMHPEEHLAFTPAAQGILHRLYNNGVIDDYLREEIIQRCIDLTEEEIGLDEVKTVTLLVLFKERREAVGDSVLKVFEESQVRLTD